MNKLLLSGIMLKKGIKLNLIRMYEIQNVQSTII